jgi:hypothetical protein
MNITQPSNWSNAALAEGRAAKIDPFYAVAQASWDEQRLFLTAALSALDPTIATLPSHPGGGGGGGAADADDDADAGTDADADVDADADADAIDGAADSVAGVAAAKGAAPTLTSSALAAAIRAEVATITAPAPPTDPTPLGYTLIKQEQWSNPIVLGNATVAVNTSTGALTRMEVHGLDWSSSKLPLFRFMYRKHSYAEKCAYAKTYMYSHGGVHPYS